MRHLIYLAVLTGCLLVTAPLDVFLHTRVYARWKRLLLTLAPVVVLFVAWDVYAIAHHHWTYDRRQTTGVVLPGHVPLEELLFFLVIPICAVFTLEAVHAATGWGIGGSDEPGSARQP